MLQITQEEAMRGLVDFGRIEEMLERTKGRVDHITLDRVSPLAAPMMLEVGRPVKTEVARDVKGYEFTFHGNALHALPNGTLWDGDARLLCVSDLHLGKSDRIVRRSGRMIPPYETNETLSRLAEAVNIMDPAIVVSLGDSFDDLDAVKSLTDANLMQIAQMQAGRDWVWIEGIATSQRMDKRLKFQGIITRNAQLGAAQSQAF